MSLKREKNSIFRRLSALALLVVGVFILTASPVSAGDPDGPVLDDPRGIRSADSVSGETIGSGIAASGVSESIFTQAPITPEDENWYAWTSDESAEYLCADDFWGLNDEINDIHWYGGTAIWDYQEEDWLFGTPTGMLFDIIFYSDNSGVPGAVAASYTDISPAVADYRNFDGLQIYRFDVDGLDVPLTAGWVSIQSTYSPSSSEFLWLVSNTGNTNAIQNDETMLDDYDNPMNLAFKLTTAVQGVGGEVAPVNRQSIMTFLWSGLVLALAMAVFTASRIIRKRRTV